ncbi:Scr1 family TA system antitoxin-like transcriptional regulator [Streptomyces sp. NPDC004610]|uniref:Scr1 family TA system antitoxin-like transcriptional regulator n=1 Tax=unclassified Streptomyces TaxID=2593676 RepID=UPI0033AD11C1
MPRPPKELSPERSVRDLFGFKVRSHRERQGWTLEAMSSRLAISKSHLARVEVAEYMPPPELPAQLDGLFGTDKYFTELYALCRKEAHPDKFRRRMELEDKAVGIREYTPQLVPGLLQTEAYARALFRMHDPRATEQRIDELWTLRLGRQALLLREPRPDYAAILDAGVLLRGYGGASVMRDQLAKLLDLSLTATTFIQVVPFSTGGQGLAGGSLSLWTLDDGRHVAYEEGISTGTLLEEKTEVLSLIRAYDLLSASALSPAESADFIRSTLEALPDEQVP